MPPKPGCRFEFVPDERYKNAPAVPTDRPPTRAEVWAWVQHIYTDVKPPKEMQTFAKTAWVGNYVQAVTHEQWAKPPDWTEGDPIPEGSVPTVGFDAGQLHNGNASSNHTIVYACLEVFLAAKKEASERAPA